MGRKQARAVFGGEGVLRADSTVLGPLEAVKRIVDCALESADKFLASDNVDPQDAAVVRKGKSDVADHKDQLFQLLASLRDESKPGELAACLGVMLAGAFLIGGRAGISETARRQIEREIKRLGTAEARNRRQQMRQVNEQILRDTIRAVFEEHGGGSLKEKYREVNRRWRAAGHEPVGDKTIRRLRRTLGLR